MQSQLGKDTPFFHAAPCGGVIRQVAARIQTGSGSFPGACPDLEFQCVDCKEYVSGADVVEERGAEKASVQPPPATSSAPPQQAGPPPAKSEPQPATATTKGGQ